MPRARRQDRPGPSRAGARLPRQPLLGLPEFDPFWDACVKAGIPVSMHASDSGYAEYLNDWEPGDEYKPFKPTAFRMVAMGKRPIEDTMAALVCHGALTRNPDLRILSVENGASWVPYLFYQFKDVHSKMPQEFPEDPIEASNAVCTSRPSGKTTSRRWPICAASTGLCSARTGRIRRASPTRSIWSTTSRVTASTRGASGK